MGVAGLFCLLDEGIESTSPLSPSPSHCFAMGPSLSPLKRGRGEGGNPARYVNQTTAFAGVMELVNRLFPKSIRKFSEFGRDSEAPFAS